ncbi:hypothetical protein IPA_00380 [Ignicoccus pacificus DSM 13166]|uniref:Uncharacterized protein n=1 Tax=Ignicoccus pacificus DSM 13166 TaxID=940294 RepID=A0A977KBD5_9CREN|nr:hypothetical protein IPA_00380 [Ignicoccus pacificus DSM 13166]
MESGSMDPAVIAAGLVFFVVLWLLLYSPVSSLLKMVVNVLTDPIVSMIAAVAGFAAAYYVVVYVLGLSLIA